MLTAFTRWGTISCMKLTGTPSPECRYVGPLQRPDAAAEENAAEHRAVQQIVRANLVTAGALMGGGPAGYERAAAFAAGPEGVEALLWLMQGRVPAPLEPPGDCAHIARDIFQTLGRSERTKAAVAAALGQITERARRAEAGKADEAAAGGASAGGDGRDGS